MSHLDTLPNIPDNMKFVCLSFLTNKETGLTATVTGVRFGGAFATYEEACTQAKAIQQLDKYHNVFVGDGGRWLPFDPDPNSAAVKDSEYADEKLNELMKGHKDNQEKAKAFHELRKTEKMIENVNENLEQQVKNKEELSNKLSSVVDEGEMKNILTSMETIDEQIKRLELKKKDYIESEQNLKKQTETPLPLYN
jgi:hypothetical protein